jgi:hypothetical protein
MPDEFKDDGTRATIVEMRLGHEFALMTQRITALVTSQAFLFAAWTSTLLASESVRETVGFLRFLLPSVGFMIAVITGVAIAAAMAMIDHLVVERARFDANLGLRAASPLRRIGWTRWAGHLASGMLPPLFAIAWITVLVRILSSQAALSNNQLLALAGGALALYFTGWTVAKLNQLGQARKEAAELAKEAAARLRAVEDRRPRAAE